MIPLYDCLSTHPSVDTWAVSPLGCCKSCCCERGCTNRCHVPRSGTIGSHGSSAGSVLGTAVPSCTVAVPSSSFPPAMCKAPNVHSCTNSCYFVFFDNGHPNGCEVFPRCFDFIPFDLFFLM